MENWYVKKFQKKKVNKIIKIWEHDKKEFNIREGIFKLFKNDQLVQNFKIIKSEQIPKFEEKFQCLDLKYENINDLEVSIMIQNEIEKILNIQPQQSQQFEIIKDVILQSNIQDIQNNILLKQVCYTSFQKFEEPENLFEKSQFFEMNGQKYFKEDKIFISNFTFLLYSQFKIDFENIQHNDELLQSKYYLNPNHLPSFLSFYNIYLYDNNIYNQYDIKKMIQLRDIQHIGFCSFQYDFLPGYNIYIQLQNQILFVSTKNCIDIFQLFYGIQNSIKQWKFLNENNLLFGYKQALMLQKQLKQKNFEQFLKTNRKILKIHYYKLNENFNFKLFKQTLQILKKILKIFTYSKELNNYKQQFLLQYHLMISNSLCRTQFEFEVSKMSSILQQMTSYQKLLKHNKINDIYLDRFLGNFSVKIEDKWIDQVLEQLDVIIKDQLQNKKKNFYMKCLNVFIQQSQDNQKVSSTLFIKTMKIFIQNIKNQILRNDKMKVSDYLDQINQNLLFFQSFGKFYLNQKQNFTHDLIQIIIHDINMMKQIYSLFEFCFTRLQQRFEQEIQKIFYNQNFTDIDIKEYLEQFQMEFSGIFKHLNIFLRELLFNNLLQFFLEYYFANSFKYLTGLNSRENLIQKLNKDFFVIKNFFQQFVHQDNLEVLLQNFKHYKNLFENDQYEILLNSLLKFNLLFKNRLCTEILISILQQNSNVSLEIEEELINFYNQCNREQEEKTKSIINLKESNINESFLSKSRIIYNSQKKENNLSNYLPHFTIKKIIQIKIHVTQFRLQQINNKQNESIFLSDFELNEEVQEVNELENILKLIIQEDEENIYDELNIKLKNQNYEKFLVVLTNKNLMFFYLENKNKIFDVDLKFIQSVKKLKNNFIQFKFRERNYYLNYPTKTETNKWFENIKKFKNEKKLKNQVQSTKIDYFKIDYIFKTNYQRQTERVDLSLLIPYNVNYFYSLKKIHNFLSENSRKLQQKSRRKSIDINQLQDTEEQSRIITNLDNIEDIENSVDFNEQITNSISEDDDQNYFSDDEQIQDKKETQKILNQKQRNIFPAYSNDQQQSEIKTDNDEEF